MKELMFMIAYYRVRSSYEAQFPLPMIELMSMIAWVQSKGFYMGNGQQPVAEDDMESDVGGDEQYNETFLDTWGEGF